MGNRCLPLKSLLLAAWVAFAGLVWPAADARADRAQPSAAPLAAVPVPGKVNPTPVIVVSHNVLTFNGLAVGPTPESRQFRIYNSGPVGHTVEYTISSSQPWLVPSPTSVSISAGQSALVTVSVVTAGLSSQLHNASLLIDDNSTLTDQRSVSASLTLTTYASIEAASITSRMQDADGFERVHVRASGHAYGPVAAIPDVSRGSFLWLMMMDRSFLGTGETFDLMTSGWTRQHALYDAAPFTRMSGATREQGQPSQVSWSAEGDFLVVPGGSLDMRARLTPDPQIPFGPSDDTSRILLNRPVTASIGAWVPEAIADPYEYGLFGVSLLEATPVPVTIHYTVGGSARPGIDYLPLSGTVVILPGAMTAVIPILPLQNLDPINRTVSITLVAGEGYELGTVTSANVLVDGADTINLAGLEAIQVVQDLFNSVPLVAGKPTYLRVYVEPITQAAAPITNARLRGFDTQGNELSDSPRAPLASSARVAVAGATSASRRANWQGTVNFHLPESWTSGNVNLKIEMDGLAANSPYQQHTLQFLASPQLDLYFVRTSIVNGSSVVSPAPLLSEIDREVARLAEMFPLAPTAVHIRVDDLALESTTALSAPELLLQLKTKRLLEGRSDIYVAAVRGTLAGKFGGYADYIPGNIVSARIDQPVTLAHEVAHALGEFHTVHSNPQVFGTMQLNANQWDPAFLPITLYAMGPDNCSGEIIVAPTGLATDFPYFDSSKLPRLGPMNSGSSSLVYGLENGSQPDAAALISPHSSVDLMYGGNCKGKQWISKHTYGRLRTAMLARTAANPPPGRPDANADTKSNQPYVAIRGLVDFDANTASLLPAVALSLASAPAAPTGSTHQLLFTCRNASPETQTISFTPDTAKAEAGDGGQGNGFFVIPVACALQDLLHVEVKRNGSVLASRDASAHAPTVTLLTPNGGEVLGGTPLLAQWNAADADGDALTYLIQFSPDGGSTWQTLSVDWTGTEFSISADSLPATSNGLLKVVASDGSLSASDQSAAPFTVPNHPPRVTVSSPSPGNFFGGEVTILLEALVRDRDQGELPDESITWSSSLDGPLGQGPRVETSSSALTAGNHLLTVSAIDGAGATTSASVAITVSRLAPSLGISGQPLDQAVVAGESASFSVAAYGTPAPSFQWQQSSDAGYTWTDLANGAGHGGVSSPTLTVVGAQAAQDGHHYRAVVSNATGSVISTAARLAVNAGSGLSIADASVVEGQSGTRLATFTITRSGATASAVSFDIATANGSATAGSDFVASSLVGQTIAAGQSSRSFTVTILGDTTIEDSENFTVNIGNVSGAALLDGLAIGTITNDDLPSLTVGDSTIVEGHSGMRPAGFTISLSSPAQAGGVAFDIATLDGRGAGNAAVAGSDFTAANRAGVLIPEGQTSAAFAVKVHGDRQRERDEAFAVRASQVIGASVADGEGVGYIVNDDALHPSAVQGTGLVSPLLGQHVVVQGIVTALARDGYFLQGGDDERDGSPASSEAVFVRADRPSRVGVAVGQRLEVSGRVREASTADSPWVLTRTEIVADRPHRVVATQPLPVPMPITRQELQARAGFDRLERYEGMRVAPGELTVVGAVGGHVDERSGRSHAEGVFHALPAGMARTFREPGRHVLEPVEAGRLDEKPRFDGNPERLRIDSTGQPGATPIAVDVGDAVTGIVGILDDGSGSYGVLPDPGAAWKVKGNASPRPVSQQGPGAILIGYLPLGRFFDADDDPLRDEPVSPAATYALRLAKTAHAICAYLRSPAIVAVSGVENLATLSDLAAASNSLAGNVMFPTGCASPTAYRPLMSEGDTGSPVKLGFLVDSSQVRPGVARVQVNSLVSLGREAIFIANDGRQIPLFEQGPSLLRVLITRSAGAPLPLTVLAMPPEDVPTRTSAVPGRRVAGFRYLADHLRSHLARDPVEDLVVLGGFGASAFDDGHGDLMGLLAGPSAQGGQTRRLSNGAGPPLLNLTPSMPAAERYSSVSEGNATAHDHALVSPGLASRHRLRCEFARVNADFGVDHADDFALPMRISDTDPMVIFIEDR